MKITKLVSALLCVFVLCGFSFFRKEKPKSDTPVPAKIEEPKKSIAIVPIQKVFPTPFYLSTHPGFLTTVIQMVKEKDLNAREQIDYDPKFVIDTMNRFLSNEVIRNGFDVFIPSQVEPFFDDLQRSEKEFSIERLNESLSANAFLLITITEWDAENFDRNGTLKVSFDAALIDSSTKKAVWTNRVVGLKMAPPGKDFLYANYQKDILRDLCHRILKGFPKKQWEV